MRKPIERHDADPYGGLVKQANKLKPGLLPPEQHPATGNPLAEKGIESYCPSADKSGSYSGELKSIFCGKLQEILSVVSISPDDTPMFMAIKIKNGAMRLGIDLDCRAVSNYLTFEFNMKAKKPGNYRVWPAKILEMVKDNKREAKREKRHSQ